MANIIGIPTTRVSDLFIRERLTNQVQMDQLAMFAAQMQLSTGRRFQMPSEEADAALRVMSLQRLLERKDQAQTNLTTNQSYLTATDTTMSTVSNNMAEVRGLALGVLGTIASDTQRAAAAQQVNQMILQLRDIGNHKFRGRYLFAGTGTTVRPFDITDAGLVQYYGDEGRLSSFSDIDLLFNTNLHGNEVFGVISEPVRGSEDLYPILTYNTRLADLRGGRGIVDGSITLSVHNAAGATTSTIDISSAETIGDVAAMIRANPPAGTTVDVEITSTGLWIQLNGAPGDSLSIREVGGGTTANELGILTATPVTVPVVGNDLDPILRLTTRVDDILGVRASRVVRSAGTDNDVIFEARAPGLSSNGINIVFVDDGSVVNRGVDEVATYTAATNTLTVTVRANATQARDVVTAVGKAIALDNSFPLSARVDPLDDVYGGRGEVGVGAFGATAGGSGFQFDRDSGLQIVNGGNTHTINFTGADTVEDVLNILNMSDAGVLAEINENATGINLRSRVSGADFMIGENGGTTATELGLRTFTETTRLEDLNFGYGVVDYEGTGTAAAATLTSTGSNNDVLLRARQVGVTWNDFSVSVVDSGGPVGSETLTYDAVAKTIQFAIVPGSTTANDLIALFQNTAGARDDFEVSLDLTGDSPNNGTGLVALGTVTTSGGSGGGVDFTIQRNDNVTLEIDITGVDTIGDMLNMINTHPDNLASGTPLVARLATVGNGIELVDDNPGNGTLTVTRAKLSTAAIGLGLIPSGQETNTTTTPGTMASATVTSAAADSNLIFRARGTGTQANGTQVFFQDTGLGPGSETFDYDPVLKTLTFGIDPGTTSANAVIGLLQGDATANTVFSVSLDPADGSPNDGTGAVDVTTATISGGTPDILTGSDVNPLETEGIFTALLRLRRALETNDPLEAQRAIELLDEQTIEFNFARAELGARQQGLDIMQDRLESEVIDLSETLSEEFDVDMVEAISNFAGRQAAFEASLRATAQIFQMSLLNYL